MKTIIMTALFLLVSSLAFASGKSSILNLEKQHQWGMKKFIQKLSKQNKNNPSFAKLLKNTFKVVKLDEGIDPGPDEPLGPSRSVVPIRFNMGKFKLERNYVDESNDYEFKEEVVCEGVLAIPVFDVRDQPDGDFYLDHQQSVTCWGMYNGDYVRYYINGLISFGKGPDLFAKDSSKVVEMKTFAGSVYAESIQFDNSVFGPHGVNLWNTFATKNLKLNHAIMNFENNNIYQACTGPIESEPIKVPVDPPVESVEPNSRALDSDSGESEESESSICTPMTDGITLSLELND